jgi:hypothetical protein
MPRFARFLLLGTLLLPALQRLWDEPTARAADLSAPSRGRPTVKLDRLTLPAVDDAAQVERYVRQVLKSEVRRADWGAGRGSVIQYRFTVEELSALNDNGVLHVTCSASGRLPRGPAARSHLAFGGSPGERQKLVEHVLGIVARGVITRLAEMERIRRGGR